MARIVHIALKVENLEKATKFYEDVFGIYPTKTGYARGHTSRHMTDGNIDLALMIYDSEEVEEATLSGAGPCIHHWGNTDHWMKMRWPLVRFSGSEASRHKPGSGTPSSS
jgi:lactoylglutathione lyase